MNNSWKEWLVFTRKERTGIFALVTIILLATCLPWFFSVTFPKPDLAMTKELHSELLQLMDRPDSGIDERYVPHYDIPAEKKAMTLFEFDPNSLPAEGWLKLGVRERLVQTIQKYLARGGKFRQPEDLKRIYGLREEDAKKLIPYVRIKSHAPKKSLYEPKEYPKYKKQELSKYRVEEYHKYTKPELSKYGANEYHKYSKPELRIIDINTADTGALIALPGIGSKLARRIISFRDKLGGFYSVGQVKETYGLPDSTFQKISALLQVSTGTVHTININAADVNTLAQHPYIGRNLANAIVKYREQHGPYKSLKELQEIVIITSEIFKKIVQYLAVSE